MNNFFDEDPMGVGNEVDEMEAFEDAEGQETLEEMPEEELESSEEAEPAEESEEQEESPELELELSDGTVHTMTEKEFQELLALKEAGEVDLEEIKEVQRMRPVVDTLLNSKGAKRFLEYSMRGYSDEEINDFLFLERYPWAKEALEGYIRQQNEQQAASSAPPEFEDIGSEISWHVQNALKKTGILSTFEQQQQQQNMMREQQAEQQLLAENDKVFYQVLSEFNIDKLTNEELEELGRGFQEVYPGTMFNKHLITPTQVRVVYNHTLGRQSRQPARQFNVRQGKLPNVLPAGNGGGRIIATPEPNRDSRGKFAAKERSARIKEFFES